MSAIDIRSYRRVFDLDRRIYRLDRLRLNPTGVPLRAVLYCAALLVFALLVVHVPLLGSPLAMLPWYLRDLAGPVAGAGLLTMVRVEGRTFHLAALALLRYGTAPRQLADLRPCPRPGRRWRPPELLVIADGSEQRLRPLRCTGPGTVLIAPAHERVERELGLLGRFARRPELTLSALPGCRAPSRAQPILLACGARLRVR